MRLVGAAARGGAAVTSDAAFRTKMAKLLEMLTSSHEGERLAAVEKANRELGPPKDDLYRADLHAAGGG
jgi:hypothetical protein